MIAALLYSSPFNHVLNDDFVMNLSSYAPIWLYKWYEMFWYIYNSIDLEPCKFVCVKPIWFRCSEICSPVTFCRAGEGSGWIFLVNCWYDFLQMWFISLCSEVEWLRLDIVFVNKKKFHINDFFTCPFFCMCGTTWISLTYQ